MIFLMALATVKELAYYLILLLKTAKLKIP